MFVHIASESFRIAQASQNGGATRDLALASVSNRRLHAIYSRQNDHDALVRRGIEAAQGRFGRAGFLNKVVLEAPQQIERDLRSAGLDPPALVIDPSKAESGLAELESRGITSTLEEAASFAETLVPTVARSPVSRPVAQGAQIVPAAAQAPPWLDCQVATLYYEQQVIIVAGICAAALLAPPLYSLCLLLGANMFLPHVSSALRLVWLSLGRTEGICSEQ